MPSMPRLSDLSPEKLVVAGIIVGAICVNVGLLLGIRWLRVIGYVSGGFALGFIFVAIVVIILADARAAKRDRLK
jgi:hypothetical protein